MSHEGLLKVASAISRLAAAVEAHNETIAAEEHNQAAYQIADAIRWLGLGKGDADGALLVLANKVGELGVELSILAEGRVPHRGGQGPFEILANAITEAGELIAERGDDA